MASDCISHLSGITDETSSLYDSLTYDKLLLCSDKAYFVDLFVRASNMPAIKMYEKVTTFFTVSFVAAIVY